MTHTIKGTPTITAQTVYHEGDDIVFYPMPGGLRVSKDEAYRLGCYLKGEPVTSPPTERIEVSLPDRIAASDLKLADGPIRL